MTLTGRHVELVEGAGEVLWEGPAISFWAVERNSRTVESLDNAIASHVALHQRVRVRILNTSFLDAWQRYQRCWRQNTFLLLDAFGWQASAPDIFSYHLRNRPGNSALLSVMVRGIVRFGHNPDKQRYMDRLFGRGRWPDLTGTPADRRRSVISRVRDIAKNCGARYVVPFDIVRTDHSLGEHHEYTLLYMGQSLPGCNVLKQAFWQVDPTAGTQYRYSDSNGCQLPLFVDTLPDALLQEWGDGRPHSLGEIADWLKGDQTRFCWSPREWTTALVDLQKRGCLVFPSPVPPSGPGSRGGFGIATAAQRRRTVVLTSNMPQLQTLPLLRGL